MTGSRPPARPGRARRAPSRRTNVALLVLLVLAGGSGALAYATGTPTAGRAIVVAHGVTGLGVILLAPWKSAIARRGLRHRGAGRGWPGLVLAGLVVATVVSGLLHTTGTVTRYGPLDDMQVHVGAALLALPFAAWHVAARPVRPRRRDVSRRELLRAGGLLAAAALAWGAVEALARALGTERRFTGSLEDGSHDPDEMPVTQWFDDDVPDVDPDAWQLEVQAGGEVTRFSRDQLDAHDDRVTAVLDCTGGWYAEQDWAGCAVGRLAAAPPGTRSVRVVSRTGYARRFPIADLPNLLLATRVGGAELSRGHGRPARLVASGRRGFWWVKWVDRIEFSPRPWWLQSPFPLT